MWVGIHFNCCSHVHLHNKHVGLAVSVTERFTGDDQHCSVREPQVRSFQLVRSISHKQTLEAIRTRMSGRKDSTMASHESVSMQNNGAETKSVNVIIKGTVQGVFYRNWTVENAQKLDLKGWVRNCRDGAVEAVFSGPSSAVDDMIEKCHSGPSSAKVSGVTVNKWDNEIPEGFEQKPTS